MIVFNRMLKRRTALIVLAALGFAQARLAIAACELDRRALTQVTVSEAAAAATC